MRSQRFLTGEGVLQNLNCGGPFESAV